MAQTDLQRQINRNTGVNTTERAKRGVAVVARRVKAPNGRIRIGNGQQLGTRRQKYGDVRAAFGLAGG